MQQLLQATHGNGDVGEVTQVFFPQIPQVVGRRCQQPQEQHFGGHALATQRFDARRDRQVLAAQHQLDKALDLGGSRRRAHAGRAKCVHGQGSVGLDQPGNHLGFECFDQATHPFLNGGPIHSFLQPCGRIGIEGKPVDL